ncbi:hypothetical protein CKM354_000075800 [Cercospora kikuchii]|uniref:Uncharacterized protein n=1 Tax=Cercospora kikuchii TaxID=84275 RepID=A0A9P3F827_9PEZI|nr:uncharacterized protein CKM354_000075800 [Cercospora kikuchii]GIZ37308.1 hypothetical protein CKM354_000075800 [Cercospora kikuchii]
MCIAGLNVTTQTCAHRWYELIRPCSPANNLQNCPERLRLEGWERRQDSCPFCDGAQHSHSTHRLFGSVSSASSVASSPTISEMGFNRYSRRGSGATFTGTMSPLSRETSNCSIELDRATRARDMNDRIHMYLFSEPHEILPSATKNYPTYSTAISKAEQAASSSSDGKPRRTNSLINVSRGIKRISKRFSISSEIFKNV